MNKNDIAGYLVSLHNLIEAQMTGQRSIPSRKLTDEYNKYWDLLKEEIGKEETNEEPQRRFNYEKEDNDA